MNTRKAVVLSCEHASNNIPSHLKKVFTKAEEALQTHRAFDLGALELFELMNSGYIAHKKSATVSRLLVDVNRSLYRRTLFSEFTKHLTKVEKEQILNDYYYTFRDSFEREVRNLWQQDKIVLHLSVHSFTPNLKGEIRHTDFGILYNPERKEEKFFAKMWKTELNKLLPDYRVRFNYPFRGKPDGFVRHFRDMESENYLGIEFEMNQKFAGDLEVKKRIALSLNRVIDNWANR